MSPSAVREMCWSSFECVVDSNAVNSVAYDILLIAVQYQTLCFAELEIR
jgi:hypothetical protein